MNLLYCVYLEGYRLIKGSKSFDLSVIAFGDHRPLLASDKMAACRSAPVKALA